jgi:hypothetical protein
MSSICEDIGEFLDLLKQMRVVDDKIVYALNTSIPTQSFATTVDASAKCQDLFQKLEHSHAEREQSLQKCLNITVGNVQSLREKRNGAPNDISVLQTLRREQHKLRELQTQVNVEEVIRGRTMKIFTERCRSYYKPSDMTRNAS